MAEDDEEEEGGKDVSEPRQAPNADVQLRAEFVVCHFSIEREFFFVNLLVRIHSIIEMILVDRPCAMGV